MNEEEMSNTLLEVNELNELIKLLTDLNTLYKKGKLSPGVSIPADISQSSV
jgi:hypothetical protein